MNLCTCPNRPTRQEETKCPIAVKLLQEIQDEDRTKVRSSSFCGLYGAGGVELPS
jgi:hypothetical protein